MWMWAIPAAILLLAAAPTLALINRLASETRRLASEIRGLGELRPALVELRADVRTAQATAARLRNRT